MDETQRLLRETARVAAGEGGEAARLAAREASLRCAEIMDEARARLAALSAEAPEGAAESPGGASAEKIIRCAAMGAIALGAALDANPDADADARALASRLLVLLRGVLDGERKALAVAKA